MKQHRMLRLKMSRGLDMPSGNVCCVHPEWRSCTCSARHRKYGIQPTSPSVIENFRSGNRSQNVAQINSTTVYTEATDDAVIATLAGASAEVSVLRDDEPRWQHSTVPSSEQAANSGSQWPEWMLGMPSPSGFSENVTAWQPFSASRRTSFTARSTSNRGRMPQGMKRSG
jgi:hypothetical protein